MPNYKKRHEKKERYTFHRTNGNCYVSHDTELSLSELFRVFNLPFSTDITFCRAVRGNWHFTYKNNIHDTYLEVKFCNEEYLRI